MARRPSARNQSNESFFFPPRSFSFAEIICEGVANETESFPKGRTHIV